MLRVSAVQQAGREYSGSQRTGPAVRTLSTLGIDTKALAAAMEIHKRTIKGKQALRSKASDGSLAGSLPCELSRLGNTL